MKYIKQFTLILTISFIGELLKEIVPFPIPASIYGMVLLFLCLETGIIRLPSVEETAKYLIEIRLLESWGILYPILAKTAIIIIISTIIVMAVSGKVTQGVIRCYGHKKTLEADNNE